DSPGLAKLSAIRAASDRGEVRRLSILAGNGGGLFLPEELSRGADGAMTGFAYPEILVRTYELFSGGREREAREYFFRYLPLIRFEAQLGVGGVGIRKEVFRMRGAISSSHVRFPAPSLDDETLRELRELVEFLGLSY
ncbi:MAG: dihydrodipicolinate synthase family protein, partial [Actinomycetota bacterium]|nr:dihydrodipicolinate synthase family protein [Actinomycetota bacterium]